MYSATCMHDERPLASSGCLPRHWQAILGPCTHRRGQSPRRGGVIRHQCKHSDKPKHFGGGLLVQPGIHGGREAVYVLCSRQV